ncbi:MAG: gamma-glutamyl-gamma-aminobutyrate hydrolase family protein [Anaerolineaceae bacterium]|nr:gamma-glutamyl-gamma-aminobutyrate hydrolase family protein [Anaerolineaceae bacterium]
MLNPSRPIIGITGGNIKNKSGSFAFNVGQAYITAIRHSGSIPLLIPLGTREADLQRILKLVDGILFTGGGDIETQRFNGQDHPRVYGVSPLRDTLEFTLMELALKSHKPFLAICRGIQVLNVAFGGDLYTDLADQLDNALKHDWYPDYPRDKHAHTVNLICGSILHDIFQADEVPVNSLHHQGIARIGKGLEAIAFAPDGLVEGLVVSDEKFAVGVQWHPECLPEDAKMQALFKAFITACQNPA